MTQDGAWPKRLTTVIAGQVQRIRGERRMSAQQLADATAELGHPVARSVIANLESGRRDTVSIAELLVLARALEVPPLLLVFPVGRERMTEVLPGKVTGTWAAAKWFTGEEPFPVQMSDGAWASAGFDEWQEAATNYFREQDKLFDSWNHARRRVEEARRQVGQQTDRPDIEQIRAGEVEYLETMLRSVEDQLRRHRSLMRRVGLDPGELNDVLAHIEGADDGER